MYVGFRGFLAALVVIGLGMGVSFGLGIAFGEKPAATAAAATTAGGVPAGAPSGAAASTGAGASAGGTVPAGAAGFGGGGGQPVSGTVESATATSLVVKAADGTSVTLTLTPQTVIRKTDTGTTQDLKAGVQVLATREGAANAATVTIVPAGTTLPGAGGGPRSGGGNPGARGTATP